MHIDRPMTQKNEHKPSVVIPLSPVQLLSLLLYELSQEIPKQAAFDEISQPFAIPASFRMSQIPLFKEKENTNKRRQMEGKKC